MRQQYFEQEAARVREEREKNIHSKGEADSLSSYLEEAYETGQVSREMFPIIFELGVIQWVLIAEEFCKKEKEKE